ncbi:MAG: hypothetical protein JW969_19465 [Spirochaetales bacterium]|nr:hypothetical protein [Spirochaetales bacterium]
MVKKRLSIFILFFIAAFTCYGQEEESILPSSQLSLELGTSVVVPLPLSSVEFAYGAMNTLYGNYRFLLGPGYLGIGGLIGCTFTQSTAETSSNYFLFNFPLGISVQYLLFLTDSFFLYTEVNGGYSLNMIRFYQVLPDVTTFKPYVQACLGAGIYSKDISVSLIAGSMFVFFNNSQLAVLTSGVRLAYTP